MSNTSHPGPNTVCRICQGAYGQHDGSAHDAYVSDLPNRPRTLPPAPQVRAGDSSTDPGPDRTKAEARAALALRLAGVVPSTYRERLIALTAFNAGFEASR